MLVLLLLVVVVVVLLFLVLLLLFLSQGKTITQLHTGCQRPFDNTTDRPFSDPQNIYSAPLTAAHLLKANDVCERYLSTDGGTPKCTTHHNTF
jgi:hypothetical protein